MSFNKIEEAVEAVRLGEMVVVLDDEERENEGDLVMAAEKVSAEAVNFMAREGRGLICVPIAEEAAARLNLAPMVAENNEPTKCSFTVSVDYKWDGVSTGISASDRAKTIKALAEDHTKAEDFFRPGHIFPLKARDGGVLVRAGHTEAAIDLAKLAGLSPAGVLCEIAREDGEMMRRDELVAFAAKHNLKIITIKDLIAFRRQNEKLVECVAETVLPTEFGEFGMKVYKDLVSGNEHVALVKGNLKGEEVLVRAQSECLTGEVFGSLKCDCRGQLEQSLKMIEEEGEGVLLYIRHHEGRGIGLTNKVKAYDLQRSGLDTVEANAKLGLAADLREYGIGAQILADLGLRKIALLTNNPKKIVGLEGYGLEVTKRVAIELPAHELNMNYLRTKKTKLGHILDNV